MINTKHYDLLYSRKKYAHECDEIEAIAGSFEQHSTPLALDLGCGTGRHAVHWAMKHDWTVVGLDRSPQMIKAAQARSVTGTYFVEQDIVEQFTLSGDIIGMEGTLRHKFDVVTALFHVVNFLPGWANLAKFFSAASRHCAPGGYLIFDTWGPAAMLSPSVKRISTQDVELIHVLTPRRLSKDTRIQLHCDLMERAAGQEAWAHSEEDILVQPVCESMICMLAAQNEFELVEVRTGFDEVDWLYVLRKGA